MAWVITSGPERLTGEVAEPHLFRWIVERDGEESRDVIVEISNSAMCTAWETMPSPTGEARRTLGRSALEVFCQRDDPPPSPITINTLYVKPLPGA